MIEISNTFVVNEISKINIMDEFTFDKLTDPSKFLELKRYFVIDETRERVLECKHTSDDIFPYFYLIHYNKKADKIEELKLEHGFSHDEIETKILTTEVNFNRIYLVPILEQMVNHFIQQFDRRIFDKAIYSNDALQVFKLVNLQHLNVLSDQISDAAYLNIEFKNEIQKSIDITYQYIQNYKHCTAENKLMFNLNQNQVVMLFHLLHKNGIIKGYKNDVSRFLNLNFQYLNDADKVHKNISDAENVGSKLTTNQVNPEITLSVLKEIFTAKNMFTL